MKTPRFDPTRVAGIAIPALLLVLVPLLLIASAAVTAVSSSIEVTRRALDEERAFQAAEAGLDEAVWRANAATLTAGSTFEIDLGRGVTGSVSVSDTATDGLDNDGDGDRDEADEDGFEVTSQGRFVGSKRRIVAFVRKIATLPALPSVLALEDPASVLSVHGNSFRMSGTDENLNGSAGSAPPVFGVTLTSPGTTATLLATLSGGQRSQIDGQGGAPSAAVAAPIDVDALADRISAFAHVVLAPGSYGSIAGFGSVAASEWRITWCTGSLTLSGNLEGAGILIVDGNLEISGNTKYTGLVLVRGNAAFSGGGSSKAIRGALLVGGNASVGTVFELGGTVDLQYSSEAILAVQRVLGRFTVVGWRETSRE